MPENNEVNETDRTAKVIFLLLLPFFICLIVFYAVAQVTDKENPSGGQVLCKVIIILLLGSYVMSSCYAFQIELTFCILITVGLVFSSVADGLTLFDGKLDNAFSYELLMFGCAHLLYAIAYGFKPVNPVMGIFVALPFIGVLMVVIPKTKPPEEYYVSAYMAINILMEWRIIARVAQHSGPLNPSVCAMATGAVSLVMSDAVLTYDKFHSPIRFSKVMIPFLYYTGQLGVASSIFHLPHKLRQRDPNLHVSGDEICDQLCSGCPFP